MERISIKFKLGKLISGFPHRVASFAETLLLSRVRSHNISDKRPDYIFIRSKRPYEKFQLSAENGCSSCHLIVKSLPETDVGKQLWAKYFPLGHMSDIKDKNT